MSLSVIYSFGSQFNFPATRFSPRLPMFLGEEIQLFNAISASNIQASNIKLIISITNILIYLAKVVKLFLSFTAHSINNTFVAKQQRYDRYIFNHSTNHSVPCRGNTEQHIARKGGWILQQIADLLATAAPDSGMNEFSSCIVLYVNYAKILFL